MGLVYAQKIVIDNWGVICHFDLLLTIYNMAGNGDRHPGDLGKPMGLWEIMTDN